MLDTFIFSNQPQVWELALPADYYDVRMVVGDAAYPQGPQRLVVEGETWLEGATTASGEFLTVSGRALVVDGALSVGPVGLDGAGTRRRSTPRGVHCIDCPSPRGHA